MYRKSEHLEVSKCSVLCAAVLNVLGHPFVHLNTFLVMGLKEVVSLNSFSFCFHIFISLNKSRDSSVLKIMLGMLEHATGLPFCRPDFKNSKPVAFFTGLTS